MCIQMYAHHIDVCGGDDDLFAVVLRNSNSMVMMMHHVYTDVCSLCCYYCYIIVVLAPPDAGAGAHHTPSVQTDGVPVPHRADRRPGPAHLQRVQSRRAHPAAVVEPQLRAAAERHMEHLLRQ